ncbi:hypothetical protein [Shewanella sp. FJAT-52076]|uniref:hypothetical protein n=1 Tax=Shewanella sp. FJAT-52076 TaxID=2864202 RepID=UPI001C655303|nr:hypothetical protein [Shewanella sp. FJAT-52076]QYJ74726.1 hypothetical protein K0H79_15430 [Shewanella sp. FJAT-52076]
MKSLLSMSGLFLFEPKGWLQPFGSLPLPRKTLPTPKLGSLSKIPMTVLKIRILAAAV